MPTYTPQLSNLKNKNKNNFLGTQSNFLEKFSLSFLLNSLPATYTQCPCFHLLFLGASSLVLKFGGRRCSFLATIYTHLIPSSLLLFFKKFLAYFISLFQFLSISIDLSISLPCFYGFDDVGLAFLGQDMPKFLVCDLFAIFICLDAMLEFFLAIINFL